MKYSALQIEAESIPRLVDRDRDAMRRLCQNDDAALDDLIETFRDGLVRYALGMVGSIDDAEDVAQQALLQFWRRRGCLELRDSDLRSYLLRSVRNHALNLQRHRQVMMRAGPRLRDTVQRVPTPVEAVEGAELQSAVEAALEALPPRRREVFTLIRFHGLSYREAAEVMGVSPQTVANQLSSALAALRRSLGPFLVEMDGRAVEAG